MLRKIFAVVMVCVAHIFASAAVAAADEPARIALLIGNQGYSDAVGTLTYTHQDVETLAAALRQIGFKDDQITIVKDADYRKMDVAIRQHAARVRAAGPGAINFFYYSGHGAANAETNSNYLIPVDVARVDSDDIWLHSFEQSTVIDRLNRGAREAIHIVVFDACRDELRLTRTGKKALVVNKGFVAVNEVQGMLIAYATAATSTAADTGIFGKIVAEEIVKPGVEAVAMFRNVQLRAKREMNQEPWMSLPYFPETYLAGQVEEEGEIQKVQDQTDLAFFTSIRNSSSPDILRTYLDRFPEGIYANLVTSLITQAEIEQSQRKEQARKEEEAARASTARELAEARKTAAESKLAAAKHVKELEAAKAEIKAEREKVTQAQAAQLKAEQEAKQVKILAEKTAAARVAHAGGGIQNTVINDKLPENIQEGDGVAANLKEYAQEIQHELARLGCYTGTVDGKWGKKSADALRNLTSTQNIGLGTPNISSKTLETLRALTSANCAPRSPNKLPSESSVEVKSKDRASEKANLSPGRTATSGEHSICYQRAQRYCSNPDNSSAIGYQACMTQTKKGCRDQ